jgi:hypothetical protein
MLAQFRKTGAMRIEGRIAYRINKGGPKGEKTPGKNLGNKFRLSATDATEEVTDFETGEKLPLDQLFAQLPWVDAPTQQHPFPTATEIPVRILGFDHLARYDPLQYYEEISAEVAKWAAATVFSASQMLAKTDALGQSLMVERVDGLMVNYEPDEKPVPVVYNIPGEPFYNQNYANGKECYLYENKLYPWTWQGRLQFTIRELQERAGLMSYGVFTITSKYDINNLTAELVQLVTAIHPLPLSQVPVIFFRRQERIASLAFDQKKSLTERRKKKQGRNEWLVHLQLEPKLINAFLTIQRQREDRLLEAALRGETPMLVPQQQTQAALPPAIKYQSAEISAATETAPKVEVPVAAAVDGPPPQPPAAPESPDDDFDHGSHFEDDFEDDELFAEEDMEAAESIFEGEISGDESGENGAEPAPELPEFMESIKLKEIQDLSIEDFPAYVAAQITTIDTVGKRRAAVKRLGINNSDLKHPSGRLQSFLALYLYGENISKQMKVDDAASKAQEDLIPLLQAIGSLEKAEA